MQTDAQLIPGGYAGEEISAKAARRPTLRERLMMNKANLTQQLADVDKAIDALDKSPDFESTLNVLNKVSHLY